MDNHIFTKLEETLSSWNIQTRRLSQEEKNSIQKNWRKTFLPTKYHQQNHKTDWHIFSFNLIPHLSNTEAIDSFNHLYVKHFTILSSNPKLTGLDCNGYQMPEYKVFKLFIDSNPAIQDFYINHYNFKWTFVITHEEEFGPYFYSEKKL